jgi:hypothetical protein
MQTKMKFNKKEVYWLIGTIVFVFILNLCWCKNRIVF